MRNSIERETNVTAFFASAELATEINAQLGRIIL